MKTYSGMQFRSVLEIQHVVLFDALDVRWEYEPRLYKTSKGWYRPDFWLPEIYDGSWFEVKPNEVDDPRHMAMVKEFGQKLFVGCGMAIPIDIEMGTSRSPITAVHIWDTEYQWCICPRCGRVGIEYLGYAGRICNHEGMRSDKESNSNRLIQALKKVECLQYNKQGELYLASSPPRKWTW